MTTFPSLILGATLDPGGLIAWLIVGLVAGFLASRMMHGGGYGIIGDIVVGILGAFIGGWVSGSWGWGLLWPDWQYCGCFYWSLSAHCHLARFLSRQIESIAIVVKAGDIDGVCQYDAPIDTITPHFCHTSKWLVTSHYAVFPTLT